ncbi:Uncharacterised protein [Vibrio cholerae]|nr:Uncharacterised protein [Vibrio cholerae]CSC69529.1 Uncharacterised protein [Vibrio cholerae]CSC86216.1 Uncharacterised protein [Vibrio cholerae]
MMHASVAVAAPAPPIDQSLCLALITDLRLGYAPISGPIHPQ